MKKTQPRDEFIRKRMERQRKIKKRRLIIGLFFTIILMIAVGVTLSLTVFFPIEEISVAGSKRYSIEQIVASAGIVKGDNLFTFTQANMQETLRKALPYVESIKVKRRLPGTVEITVKDAEEYVCYSKDGKYYSVSKSGFVLNKYDAVPENVFEIKTSDVKCKLGNKIEFTKQKSEKLVNNIINGFSHAQINVNYIDINDSLNITAKVEGRFIVTFGTSNSLENKINHLSGMVKNIDASKTGKINLSMWTASNTEGTFVEGSVEN